MIDFLQAYWGIILVLLIAIAFIIWDREAAWEWAQELVMEVEKNARKYGLETLLQKKDWVYSWYPWLPKIIRLFVSERLWKKLVDKAYKKLQEIKFEETEPG